MDVRLEAKLDLRFNGKLIPEISPLFNKIAYERRNHFNKLVSILSLPHKNNLDWWVQGPASRNTYGSPFFHYYCCLCLINHLVEEGSFKFGEVLVDSPVFRRLIEKFLNDRKVRHCIIRCDSGFISTFKKKLKHCLSTPVLFLKKVIQCFIAKLTRKAPLKLNVLSSIVLIDTFVTPGYVTPDRWYGNLWDLLDDDRKAETFFVPTIVMVPIMSMHAIYNTLRRDAVDYLIKEDYLKLSDIVFAFQHKKRIREIEIEPIKVFDCDISGLVQEEMETNRDYFTIIESILTYRFVKRLNQSGAKVRLAIDWFEGQVIDKAWNLAFKEYFPEAKRIGYRAFESYPFYLCSYPISIEREVDVIPDTMAVQGKGAIPTVKEFLPDLNVMLMPSFRSRHVWEFAPLERNRENFKILVALPISVAVSIRIIMRLIDVHSSISVQDKIVQYILKPHPTVSIDKILGGLQASVPNVFLFSEEKSFPKLLAEADLLITEASSSCLEALACGIPVLIIENDEGLTYDPVPKCIPDFLYFRADTQRQLNDGIKRFSTLSDEDLNNQKDYGNKIREDYFEPITKEGVERLMDLVKEKV